MLQKPFAFLCLLLCTCVLSAQTVDVQHYRFDLSLNDNNDTLAATAMVELKLLQPTMQFALNLKSMKNGRGMLVKSVSGSKLQRFQHSMDSIRIHLKNESHNDSLYTFIIQYAGVPADGLIIAKNRWNDRTFFADNWPNRAQHWLPCNDRPDDKASVDFTVMAPAHYGIISNGLLVEETILANNLKWTHWRETVPIPTKVMVIGAARFAVKDYDSVRTPAPVSAWVYPQDSTNGFYDYALAPRILHFFQDYIGPYAFEKLANVQSKTIFGGMENASAIFYNESSVTGTRASEGLLAHEIAHQWFGNMVTEKSFAHLWLSEGFASYLTHLYLEQTYGKDTLLKGLKNDRIQIIRSAKEWNKPVVDSTSEGMDLLNANSYQKGSWALHMLRAEVGDAVYQKIIQTYYAQYKSGNAATKDFQAVAEAVSGKDFETFFRQWLHTPGHPQLQVRWQQIGNNEISVTVKQLQPTLFAFPLRIGLRSASGALPMERLNITQRAQTFRLKGYTNIQQIVLDPFTELLFEGSAAKEK